MRHRLWRIVKQPPSVRVPIGYVRVWVPISRMFPYLLSERPNAIAVRIAIEYASAYDLARVPVPMADAVYHTQPKSLVSDARDTRNSAIVTRRPVERPRSHSYAPFGVPYDQMGAPAIHRVAR